MPAGHSIGPVNCSGLVKCGPALTKSDETCAETGADTRADIEAYPPPPRALSAAIIAFTPSYIS